MYNYKQNNKYSINHIFEQNNRTIHRDDIISLSEEIRPNSTVVCIPVFNEELTIATIVLKLMGMVDYVFVVDDGSSDMSAELASVAGAYVIKHDTNMGYGSSLKTCFEVSQAIDAQFMIILDGDGQHDTKYVPSFIELLKDGNDLVLGTRFLNCIDNKDIPRYRKIGMKMLDKATNLSANSNLTDSQCGYRGYSRNAINALKINSNNMFAGSEILINAMESGLKIFEIPVNIRYDVINGSSKNPFSHGMEVMYNILGAIGYHRPLLLFSLAALCSGLIGLYFGIHVLNHYWNNGLILFGSSLAATLFSIIAVNLFTVGLILNYLIRYKIDDKI